MGKKKQQQQKQKQTPPVAAVVTRGTVATRGSVATGGSVATVIPCLADPLQDVLRLRTVHGRIRKVLTVDQFLHHKRYKGKNPGILTARTSSGTVYTLPVDPKDAATPADPFRTAGATASS